MYLKAPGTGLHTCRCHVNNAKKCNTVPRRSPRGSECLAMPADCTKAAKRRGCSQSASLDAQWKARQQWPFPICAHSVAVRRYPMGERLSEGPHQQACHGHAPCWRTKFRRVCEKVAKKKQGVALLSWLRGRLSANRLYNEFTVGG